MRRSLRGHRGAGGTQPTWGGGASAGGGRGLDLEDRAAKLTFTELGHEAGEELGVVQGHGLGSGAQDAFQRPGDRGVGDGDEVR